MKATRAAVLTLNPDESDLYSRALASVRTGNPGAQADACVVWIEREARSLAVAHGCAVFVLSHRGSVLAVLAAPPSTDIGLPRLEAMDPARFAVN